MRLLSSLEAVSIDILATIDVGMQDICEKALVDKLKELNATVGVVVLMEVATGEVKAIVNMTPVSYTHLLLHG